MSPSLEQLLSITPFTSLVPTQDLAGLLVPGIKSTCPSVTNSRDTVLHDEINAHPEKYADVLDHIGRQFAEFSDPQLDELDFKQPLHIHAPLSMRPEAHRDSAAAVLVHSPKIVAQCAQMGAIEARIDSAVLAPVRKQHTHGSTPSMTAPQLRLLLPARDTISVQDGDSITHSTSYLLRSDMLQATLLTMELLMKQLNDSDSAAWADRDKHIVSAAWLVKVHDCLLRLDQHSTFGQINLEELRNLQQTCFRCLTECIEQHAWHNDDPMGLVMAAVVACKCMLLVMANRSERGLFVDEYLNAIIDVNYNVVENMVAEALDVTHAANISPVVACVCDVLTLLGQFSTNGHVDDYILTRLEYLAIYAIFLPALTPTSKHKSALPINTLETLRWNSSQLLTTIFKFHPKQRPFILRDVLDSFSKVSQLTFKTFRGVSVSVTTVVLLNLVQSVDMSRAYLAAANIGTSDDLTLTTLCEELLYLLRQSEQACVDITQILLNKLNNSQLEGHVRPRFESLVLDLIDLLPFPEWSVAEVLLNAIMTRLIEVTEELKSADAFILDIMGNIGIHIVPSPTKDPADNHSPLLDLLRFVQLQAKKNRFYHAGWGFLILKLAANGGNGKDLKTLESLASVMAEEKPHQSFEDIDSLSTYASLLRSCRLYLQYQRFIKVVVQSINSTKVKTRSKAMKIISSLSEVDTSLILTIQLSISSKLSDLSPMVRDSVLDLIAHILKPELVPRFYQPVCERLNDSSVQVRRRLVKVCKDLYGMTSDIKVLTHISVRMLRKLNDEEETIAAQVWDSMVELWFGLDLNKLQSTQVMMEITSSSKTHAHLLKEFVLRATLKRSGALKRIVDELFEHLHKKLFDDKYYVVKALKLLCLIADNSQGSIISQDQLIALQPLILDEDRWGEACYYVLKLFNVTLRDMGLLRRSFLASMETVMLKRLTRFSMAELDEAMPCIWQLCAMSGNTVKLANASISCIRHVRPYIGQLKGHKAVDSSEVPKLRKLLNLLGAFGKYGRFEPYREVYQMANIGLKDSESIVSLIAKILLFFCSQLDGASDMKRIAIENMMGICSSHPNLFVSETMISVLDHEFEQSDDVNTKLVIIEGLIKYLENEEARLQKRQAAEGHHKRVDLEIQSRSNVNDNISASTIQRYTRFILPLCLHDDGTRSNRFLAFTPVRYLQLVIALGFANPKTCISTVIAMEATPNAYVKQIAMEMHRDLFEKHESLVDTSYYEAIKLAVAFRLRCHGSIVKERFFFKDLYSIVAYSRASRRKFTQSLCKTLVVGPRNVSEQKAIVVYSVVNISTISFVASEDVYMIVHHLDLVIMNQGLDILEKISSRGNTEVTLASLVVVQIYIALMSLRQFLCLMYGILVNQLDDYSPTGRVDADLKQPPRCVRLDEFVLDSSVAEEDLESSDAQIRILGSFVERIKQITG